MGYSSEVLLGPGRTGDLTVAMAMAMAMAVAAAVTRDGGPVRDFQPCPGACGHLVALRRPALAPPGGPLPCAAAGSGRPSARRSKQAIHMTS